jgi:hypothetical protein
VQPVALVGAQGALSEELRQFPRSLPSQQVHLKEPVLSVQESQGHGDVLAAFAADRRDSELISFDQDTSTEACQGSRAVELRQAAVELLPCPVASQGHQ